MRNRSLLAAVMTVCLLSSVQASALESLDQLARVAVSIRAERLVKDRRMVTTGSGFFIHSDGFVLTSFQTVADQIGPDARLPSSVLRDKVLKLTVVVDSGTLEERELAAKIVARDHHRQLALLKVEYNPEQVLDIDQLHEVSAGDTITVLGFSYADLPAQWTLPNRHLRPHPWFEASAGEVIALEASREKRAGIFAGRVALESGDSGAAILDDQARLVGVALADGTKDHQTSFGVSARKIREFLVQAAIEVDIEPRIVLDPPRPITVSVKPVFSNLEPRGGDVRLQGSDIEDTVTDLEYTESVLQATIVFPQRLAGKPRPMQYRFVVSLDVEIAGQPVRRSFVLDAIGGTMMAGSTQRERKTKPIDVSAPTPTPRPDSLAGFADAVEIRKNASGETVIDDSMVDTALTPTPGLSPTSIGRFDFITDPSLDSLVRRYDNLSAICRGFTSYHMMSPTNAELVRRKNMLATILNANGVRFCREGLYILVNQDPPVCYGYLLD